jgi:hypothetical protein
MPTDLQNRAQYLKLAEFCQPVISSLICYIDGSESLQTNVLKDARVALSSVKSGDPYRFGQRPTAALGSYQQVRTLEEVWRDQLDNVISLTSSLIEQTKETEDEHKAKAKALADLFIKLQTKALWNFEQPGQTAPPDVGELCKALNAT